MLFRSNNAIDYCKNLALCNDNTWQGSTTTPGDCSSNGGTKYDDWRLPTVIEGVTMLDYSCASAGESCYGDFQNNALTWDNTGDTGSFWLSTTRPEDTVSAYQPSTGLGSVGSDNKVNPYYQRCVRK